MSSDPATLRPLFSALEIIDQFVAQWQDSFIDQLACQRRCSVCCTDRVTVTEAEAARILAFSQPEALSQQHLRKQIPSPVTTNEFAYACLHGVDLEAADFSELPSACPFLTNAMECTVYQVRPLMCRLFISTVPCKEGGEAIIQEGIFLTQIVLQQLTEHISQGTKWGNLITMLRYCSSPDASGFEDLRVCREIPGFPLSPQEKKELAPRLQPLFDRLKSRAWLEEGFSLDFAGVIYP